MGQCIITCHSGSAKALWTNPSPNNAFAAQTISLDLSSYQLILVLYKTFNNHSNLAATVFPVAPAAYKLMSSFGGTGEGTGNSAYSIRPFTLTTTGLAFSACQPTDYNNSSSIPFQIWGIRF